MLALMLACQAPSPPPPAPAQPPPPPATRPSAVPPASAPWTGQRIVAIGDLHGDLDNALAVLRLAGLTDEAGRWTGGDAVLVQTGDVYDRGDEGKQIVALLRRLVAEAPATGGRVVPLLGNHEVMNLRGDLRYVTPGDFAAYGGEAARVAALAPAGEDGKWLRTLGATARVGETVFVHGGLRPEMASGGADAINGRVREALDAPGKPAVLGEDGPLWFRGYVNAPETEACALLAQALPALGARRMVVGHTTRSDGRIQTRCDGALVVIDIGIADHYGAHLGALELRGGADAWALYPGGPLDLPDPP